MTDRRLSWASEARDFFRRLYSKAEEDNIFFMAGAISFNLLVAVVPLLLLSVGISGIVLSARFGDPTSVIISQIQQALPAFGDDADASSGVQRAIGGLLEDRTGFSIVGAVLFVWLSTRLVGTLRTVLREVFDVAQERSILRGKLFDAAVVLMGGGLVLVNVGVTVALRAVRDFGIDLLGLHDWGLRLTELLFAQSLALLSIWVLFLLVYRYLPVRRIPWRTSIVAATFTAIVYELLKQGFSWYVTSVASYSSTFGNLATVAVFFFWLYYSAIAFVLGGEVAQIYALRRARRVDTRRALAGG